MFKSTPAFSGFSVNDVEAAKQFYGEILGLEVIQTPMGLQLQLGGSGAKVFVYGKQDHQPASFTILNFSVEDIDKAVTELKNKGVQFERYDGMTDQSGVARGRANNRGPDIAWFKDPANNILSVLQES